ncbi:regulator of G-protein signaling 9-binding protein [Mugil cephalus]|uniref:regulator of G-protein signaling 9-binding protein n=1 Tax=Mugil cephalus TaxID=48193 RepID=UPI001FB85DE1|nr:regulator of G-protein signaling 9-binding protein [Mugil cephalus]
MPLINNKVGNDSTVKGGDDCTDGKDEAVDDGKALVDSLIKVVACYRHLAACVGGSTDTLQLRDELRQTREKAQKLAVAICQHLTSRLRDKSLPEEQRKEMELLWVAFSSSLELLHVDMCKVFNMGDIFSPANPATLVQTGVQGGGTEVAARALSLPDMKEAEAPNLPESLETEERCTMEKEISQIDHMIDDMEMKVNVLRWMVEPQGPQYADPLSTTDSASLALMSIDEEQPGSQPTCQRSHIIGLVVLSVVILLAATLSIYIVFFS